MNKNEVVNFLRCKNYVFIRDIGQGGCGKTVLLKDDIIDEYFVCKKYSPYYSQNKEMLFANFINEIKLLHLCYHNNIVRVFNYYLYPEHTTGYILMEYIQGKNIGEYIGEHPEDINSVFVQSIEGFKYLEDVKILHRGIRLHNILVTQEGIVKIIDLGFGKKINFSTDYDKSIELNWWCEVPDEFKENVYDTKTEVYFVGKLFEKLILENNIKEFKYKETLKMMIKKDVSSRIDSFEDVLKTVSTDKFLSIEFTEEEKLIYRSFADSLVMVYSKIEYNAKYNTIVENLINSLESLLKNTLLEEYLYDNRKLARCFINGSFRFYQNTTFPIWAITNFVNLLKGNSKEKQNVILNNLWSRLDSIERFSEEATFDLNLDNLPF